MYDGYAQDVHRISSLYHSHVINAYLLLLAILKLGKKVLQSVWGHFFQNSVQISFFSDHVKWHVVFMTFHFIFASLILSIIADDRKQDYYCSANIVEIISVSKKGYPYL